MLSFNNNQELKDELIAKLKHHQELDTFIQGQWLTNEKVDGNGFKGCFYGCTMQTTENPIQKFSEKYNIDLWYCYLTEKIFENLPDGEYQKFPLQSIEILPIGFNITKIKSLWFKTTLLKQLDWINDENIRTILQNTASLFDVDFDKIDINAARSAAESAWSAAEAAARSAAESAAESAAWSAAWSAAESAARSAAWSAAESAARSAAESAARSAESNHYVFLRDLLFKLIAENSTSV
jgi:hypothetical protein